MTVEELVSQLQNVDSQATVVYIGTDLTQVPISVVNIQRTQNKSLVLLTTNAVQSKLEEQTA